MVLYASHFKLRNLPEPKTGSGKLFEISGNFLTLKPDEILAISPILGGFQCALTLKSTEPELTSFFSLKIRLLIPSTIRISINPFLTTSLLNHHLR